MDGGADGILVRLLNVPFVQAGQPHGNIDPPKPHTAFQQCFAAHVEGGCLRKLLPQTGDDGSFDPRSNQKLRAALGIAQMQKLL